MSFDDIADYDYDYEYDYEAVSRTAGATSVTAASFSRTQGGSPGPNFSRPRRGGHGGMTLCENAGSIPSCHDTYGPTRLRIAVVALCALGVSAVNAA